MADDEFVIGFSDSEWTGIAPLLEEDVAMSSLAQDEIGHAAALYGLLADLTGEDPDAIAYDRAPDEYRHARLLDHGRGDWAMTIARRFLYETADAVRLEALAGGSWAPLAELVGKMQREERYHPMHVEAWLTRLGPRGRRGARATGGSPPDPRAGRADRLHAAPRGAGARRGRDPRRRRCATSRTAGASGSRRRCGRSTCRCPRPTGRPPTDGPVTDRAFQWLWGEFTARAPRRSGSAW